MTITSATLQADMYKNFHASAYHPEVTEVYSNFTNRFGKYAPNNKLGGVINVGLQYFIKDFLLGEFAEFFKATKEDALKNHKRIIEGMLGTKADVTRWEALHDLGLSLIHI